MFKQAQPHFEEEGGVVEDTLKRAGNDTRSTHFTQKLLFGVLGGRCLGFCGVWWGWGVGKKKRRDEMSETP